MSSAGGVGRASALLASGTIVSRVLGFVSAVLLTQTLGQHGVSDLFAIANQLPNNIYAIVAGGLFSAVFVPAIVKAGLDHDGGQGFVNRLVTLGTLLFLLIGVLATIGAPVLVPLYANGTAISPEAMSLAIAFGYWCLPQVFFYALYSLLGEVLNARGVFGPFTWVPVLNNLVAIAGLVLFNVLFTHDVAQGSSSGWTAGMVVVLAGTATLGVATQAIGLVFFWRRAGLTYRPDFRWRGVGLGAAGRAAAWTFGMVLVTQLAGLVQARVSTLASGDGSTDASVRILGNSWLIFMLPHSIAAVSIATAYFTRMSTHFRDGRLGQLGDDLAASLTSIGLVIVFASAGLIVLAYPFSAVFSSTGFAGASEMAPVLIAYLVGLVPFSMLFVLRRTFYAVGDTRTPFFATVVQAVLFVALVLLVGLLPTSLIAVGVAAVTTIAGIAQTAFAFVALRRRLGHLRGRAVLRRHVQYAVACLPAVAVGLLLVWVLGGFRAGGFGSSGPLGGIVTLAVGGSVMALVYAGALHLMRVPEFAAVIAPVLRRIRRS